MILKDGRRLEQHVERAIGSPENPMSDEHLESKFRDVAGPVVGRGLCDEMIEVVWSLDLTPDIRSVTELMA